MQRQGVFFDDEDISLSKLCGAIEQIIGREATELVIEEMLVKLEELHETKKN